MKTVFAFVFLLLFAAPAYAQNTVPENATTIEADDALEWNQKNETYTARGNAVATRGDLNIRADTLTAYNKKQGEKSSGGSGDISRLTADGNVVITQLDSKAVGDHADYDATTKEMVLTGQDLKITTPQYIVTAEDNIKYNDATGVATATGSAALMEGERRLAGDVLTATFSKVNGKNELKTLTARGNVVVTTATEVVRGDRGNYDTAAEKAIIEGNVKITRGQNQLNGDRAEIDTKSGISRLLASPSQNGQKPRIRALIFPKGKTASP